MAKSGKKLPSGLSCVQQRVAAEQHLFTTCFAKKQSNQGLKEVFTTHRSSWPRWPGWTPGSSGFGFRTGGARSIRGSRLRFWSLERSENPDNKLYVCLFAFEQTDKQQRNHSLELPPPTFSRPWIPVEPPRFPSNKLALNPCLTLKMVQADKAHLCMVLSIDNYQRLDALPSRQNTCGSKLQIQRRYLKRLSMGSTLGPFWSSMKIEVESQKKVRAAPPNPLLPPVLLSIFGSCGSEKGLKLSQIPRIFFPKVFPHI